MSVEVSWAEKLRDAENAGSRIQVKGNDGNSGLVSKCCPQPNPMVGGLIEYIGETGRRQALYCLNCRKDIAVLSWNVGA